MENKEQTNNYNVIDGVMIKEDTYKDRIKVCKELADKEPKNIYLCVGAKVEDMRYFEDDKGNEKIALQLNENLVQVMNDNQRKLHSVFFDFTNNFIRIVCEPAQLKPLREYFTKPLLLSMLISHCKISFYQIYREGGKKYTLTNGVEYTADNPFFENVLLKVEVDEKIIPTLIQTAVMLAK